MATHRWTVEEARAYLPRLRELVALVQEAVQTDDRTGQLRMRAGAEHAEAALEELNERGVILRQLAHGLVDLPSTGDDGELRFLCWRVGEAELSWWHRPDDGFAGRRPLA
ncbi:MAG TPA: DUF2203 family protein [Acidimicrobiales bacterium]|nr:DUF2203 family protein [Acidimicrobiales bacterium]